MARLTNKLGGAVSNVSLFSYWCFYPRFIVVQNTISHMSKNTWVLFKRNKKKVKFQLLMHTGGLKNDRWHVGGFFRRFQLMTGIFNLKNEHKQNLTNKNMQKCQIHKINATASTKICTNSRIRIFAYSFHVNSLWQTYNKKILQMQDIHTKMLQ